MTALLAGSIALVTLSATALAFGWLLESSGLIWTSIGASGGSGVCLAVAYARSRAAAVPPPPLEMERVLVRPARDPPTPKHALFDDASGMAPPPPPGAAMVTHPAAAPTRPETPGPPRAASKPQVAPSSDDDVVIVVPVRAKYHRPECRYARVEGADRMTRGAARRRSYSPCGICRP